jgi:hypothetical protein
MKPRHQILWENLCLGQFAICFELYLINEIFGPLEEKDRPRNLGEAAGMIYKFSKSTNLKEKKCVEEWNHYWKKKGKREVMDFIRFLKLGRHGYAHPSFRSCDYNMIKQIIPSDSLSIYQETFSDLVEELKTMKKKTKTENLTFLCYPKSFMNLQRQSSSH